MKSKALLLVLLIFGIFSLHESAYAQAEVKTYTSLQEALKVPEKVVRLDLSNQEIDFSLETLQQFKNMEYLSLRNDGLVNIPPALFELKQLKVLDLSGNEFEELPVEISRLTNLEELYLNDEKNLNLSQSIDVLSQLPNLRSLHLENDRMNVFPENIFKLDKLEYLYLNENELIEIPQGINKMNQLKLIDLQDNPIPPPIKNEFKQEGNTIFRF